jgi:hypothetical protein
VPTSWLGVLLDAGVSTYLYSCQIISFYVPHGLASCSMQAAFYEFVCLPLIHALASAFPGAGKIRDAFLANYATWTVKKDREPIAPAPQQQQGGGAAAAANGGGGGGSPAAPGVSSSGAAAAVPGPAAVAAGAAAAAAGAGPAAPAAAAPTAAAAEPGAVAPAPSSARLGRLGSVRKDGDGPAGPR